MQIRTGEGRDQEALTKLAHQLHPHLADRSVRPPRQGARIFLAEEAGTAHGFAVAAWIDYGLESVGTIEELIVDEEARGRGIGGRLLQACIDWLRDNEIEVVFVSTLDDAAEAFYAHHGFSRCKRPFMVRPVAPDRE